MRKYIPNTITGLNLLTGCIAVTMAFNDRLLIAALCILIAAVFDFCDGMFARLLNAYSDMGKELDSLADLISFGFAPSAIAYSLTSNIYNKELIDLFDGDWSSIVLLIPFLMVVFSGFRLAKFNVDTRQVSSFIGMPTPANAVLWASFPVVLNYGDVEWINSLLSNGIFVNILIVISASLLVMELPMFSFKMKNFKIKENIIRYLFVLTIILLINIWGISLSVFIIPIYVIFSLINNLLIYKKS